MDIHTPKAAHSVREFAVEIGTIICGILIALGLEQAVEFSRSQNELNEARKAIASQLAADLDFETLDAGPLAEARLLESLALM